MAELPLRCNMVSVITLRHESNDTIKTLLVKRTGAYLHGAWSYIAGHINHNEQAWHTALRELEEETTLTPTALYATGFCEQVYFAAHDCIMLIPAFVVYIAPDAQVSLNHEHSDYCWATLKDAAQHVPFGSQRDLYAHIMREFIHRQPSPFLRITGEYPI